MFFPGGPIQYPTQEVIQLSLPHRSSASWSLWSRCVVANHARRPSSIRAEDFGACFWAMRLCPREYSWRFPSRIWIRTRKGCNRRQAHRLARPTTTHPMGKSSRRTSVDAALPSTSRLCCLMSQPVGGLRERSSLEFHTWWKYARAMKFT